MKTLLQYFFLLFLFNISTITTTCANTTIPSFHHHCIQHQQLLLLNFKKTLTFPKFDYDFYYNPLPSKFISWNSSTDCCSWLGVTCSTNGHVVGLDISSQSISGGIDNSSSLFDLQQLQSLNLADNELFNGTSIPSAIGKLTNLRYLNLSYISYIYYDGERKIPVEISQLTRLVVLDISQPSDFEEQWLLESPKLSMLFRNLTDLAELYLDGINISTSGTEWCQAISSSLPNLRVLSLSDTLLSGPVDQSLTKLQSLSVLRLDHNDQLSGPIPGFFANFSNLREFSWDWNNVSAPFPRFFANFSKLTSLSLSSCSLQGTFPKEIFQVPTLKIIDLSWNEELHGSLPEFPNNGSLRSLVLRFTNFSGSLPSSIENLKLLETIELSYSSFTGSIPKSMGNLTQLVHLGMSSNRFSGAISSIQWENLINLAELHLHGNLLEGSIPPSLFSHPSLRQLGLSHNRFSGQLSEFSNASSNLVDLHLSFNNLEGPIPVSIFNLGGSISSSLFSLPFPLWGETFPLWGEIILSNNNFSGQLPEFSNISSNLVTWLDLSFNNLEGPIPVSIFNLQGLERLDLSSNNFSAFPFNGPQRLENLRFVDLSNNSLLTFPGFLRNQSSLEALDLSDNQIQGEIPNWIWKLSSLSYLNLSRNSLLTVEAPLVNSSALSTIDLHSNQLQGKFPIFFPSAKYLDYSRNNFSSSIPTEIGDFLNKTVFFSLSSNNLHGPIPVSICNATYLRVLDLSNNSLSGMIPRCLAGGSFVALHLRRNNLTGNLSNSIFTEDCSLESLDLSENQIEGQLPKSLFHCTRLQILNLGNNHITDSFPCFLKNIFTLRVLVLRSNKFYGRIGCPEANGTWPRLQIIDVADNNFNGEIPAISLTTWQAMMDSKVGVSVLEFEEWGYNASSQDVVTVTSKGLEMNLLKIISIFTLIDFSCNNFSGQIPNEMGDFQSLHILNLSKNAFTGEIPSSLGNMRNLESLDLSHNKLSGEIPSQLANLSFLSFMNLSNNQLVGRIPTSTQFSTFPSTFFMGNKGLWGPPLTVDNKTGLSPPPPSNGSHQDSEDEINWDLIIVEIGFASGFAIAIGSLAFCKRWSKWYYKSMFNILLKIFPQLEEKIGPHRRHVHINQRWRR